ncbi:MAG: dickkopf-related protein [Candidatus Nanohaloarchaea archaeon]
MASEHKDSIITVSLLLYVAAYLLIGVAGVGFQAQPAAAQNNYEGCQNDGDCGSGEYCDFTQDPNTCVDRECTSNSDCGSGEVCVNNIECRERECTNDDDCSNNRRCDGGLCVGNQVTAGPDECGPDTSNSCDSGYKCINPDRDTSYCEPAQGECVNNGDCSGENICRDNSCVSPQGASCS